MKFIYYGLAIFTVLLAGYTLFDLLSFSNALVFTNLSDLKGFGDNGQSDPEYEKLIQAFNQKIAQYKADSEKYRESSMWLSLAVTVLTALSTLFTTLKAAKSETATSKFVQGIAVLGFLSTITSWGNTQLTNQKSQSDQNTQKCRDEKLAFYTNYDKATDPVAKNRLIRLYQDKLVDL